MNKKFLSGLLISSAIVLPLSVVAVSWSTDQKANDEKFKNDLNLNNNTQVNEQQKSISGLNTEEFTMEKLNEHARKIKLDYKNKENTYPWDVDYKNFSTMNVSSETVVSNIKVRGMNSDDLGAVISFTLSFAKNPSVNSEYWIQLEGFKKLPKDHSNLSKALFNDNKGYFKLNTSIQSTLSLYKELAKPDAGLTFDFSSNKILAPLKETVNIGDQRTFEEVGEITPAFRAIQDKLILEVTKILRGAFIFEGVDLFDITTKLVTLPTLLAAHLFWEHLETFTKAALSFGYVEEFWKKHYINVDKLIKSNNFSLVYNHKSGKVSLQSDRNEVDFNDSRAYSDVLNVNDEAKKNISEKIKEVLKNENAENSIIDLFFNGEFFNLAYIIQKNVKTITTGFKIKQVEGVTTNSNRK